MTKTEELLLKIYNKPRLTFGEVCHAINISVNTGYDWRAQRRFPIALSGSPRTASLERVAAHLDKIEEEASLT